MPSGKPFRYSTRQTNRSRSRWELAPISDDEIEALAVGWWSEFRESRLTELTRRNGWIVSRLWDVTASEWALADENELAQSVERFVAGPRNLDYIFRPELDLIKALLDDPKRASGLVRNKVAMSRLLRACRLHHHAVADGWGDELRERSRATDRVLAAIHAGKLEPQEIIVRMIEKRAAAVPEHQARKVGGRSPIPFNNADGGDDLIAKWAKWRKPRPKTVYETRRIMRKLTNFVGFDDLTRLSKADVERWLEHLDDTGAAPKTLEGHLLTLKMLANFAAEKDMISDNPIAKVRYRAKANPRKKIRAYTNPGPRCTSSLGPRLSPEHRQYYGARRKPSEVGCVARGPLSRCRHGRRSHGTRGGRAMPVASGGRY